VGIWGLRILCKVSMHTRMSRLALIAVKEMRHVDPCDTVSERSILSSSLPKLLHVLLGKRGINNARSHVVSRHRQGLTKPALTKQTCSELADVANYACKYIPCTCLQIYTAMHTYIGLACMLYCSIYSIYVPECGLICPYRPLLPVPPPAVLPAPGPECQGGTPAGGGGARGQGGRGQDKHA
jgi:hypothetical protein